MKPHPKHQSLFFTPRTPWGTRLTGRTFHDHMHASEDAPNAIQRGFNRVKQAFKGASPFIGAEGEKGFGTGEPFSGGLGLGVHLGPGEPSTGDEPHQDNSEWVGLMHHNNEDRTNRERTEQEGAHPKSPDQIRMEKGIADRAIDQRRRSDASYARFLEGQKKGVNARP